ncbi:uncharacterized protein DUF262 [Aquimarina sp. MAR_2010_214]|uniref:DUF262 domain-containing protein n=1 Tax=Aquimarina sp. MAR_2010_214 TaxID=1250026 RepID=UPI000C70D259|nr:DUF262 domain-containing protein [Aquimarina sp. MAR_2010_214]PKV52559.1 uncharacterized protein DUF262 [Aquimarina sp. MAR_2010_214]
MSKQIQVKPDVHRILKFLSLIEDGKFKIPTFQRDFVWGDKEKTELFDSISKEYPIGSILLWQPKNNFANKSDIGPYKIKHYSDSNYFYILDGFQRLSTLFGCLTNPNKTELKVDQNKLEKEFTMFYDLEDEEFKMKKRSSIIDIPVYQLVDTFEFLNYIDTLRSENIEQDKVSIYIERAKKLSSTLIDYQIPSIEIYGGSIKDAVDIFSRVNSKGIDISSDWMLSALTSNEDSGFNLGELFEELLIDLQEYNFHNIKREILVQCIQSSFGKIYFDQPIESLVSLNSFRSTSLKSISSIEKAVKFLFEELLVVNKRLLPYNYQLIFLTYFFNRVDVPNPNQIKKLKDWFWTTSYSNYFTIFSLSKIRLAFEQFQNFTNDESINPVYYEKNHQFFFTADLPNSVSAKSVRSKTFELFLLNYSNDFNNVNSFDIDNFKLVSLFKGDRSHSAIVPLLIYSKNSNSSLPFEHNKQKDLSYILDNYNIDSDLEKFFIFPEFREYNENLNKERILDLRLDAIQEKEKAFVERLGLEYLMISLPF